MLRLTRDYFHILFHPFESHGQDSAQRSLELQEALSFSWIFALLRSFFLIGEVYIGATVIEELNFFEEVSGFDFFGKTQSFTITFILFGVVLYPIATYFKVNFWIYIIGFFQKLFGGKKDESGEIVAIHSLCTDFFYCIPVFGTLFSEVLRFFYLYAGLRKRLTFSAAQALTTILAPFMIIGLLISIIIFQFYINFSLLF